MARKTDGEKIEALEHKVAELDKKGAILFDRLALSERSLDEARAYRRDTDARIHELERTFAAKLAELQRANDLQLAAVRLEYERQLADLRRDHDAETRLLKHRVEDLNREQLRWAARLWQAAVGVSVVVVGAAFTTYLGLKR